MWWPNSILTSAQILFGPHWQSIMTIGTNKSSSSVVRFSDSLGRWSSGKLATSRQVPLLALAVGEPGYIWHSHVPQQLGTLTTSGIETQYKVAPQWWLKQSHLLKYHQCSWIIKRKRMHPCFFTRKLWKSKWEEYLFDKNTKTLLDICWITLR